MITFPVKSIPSVTSVAVERELKVAGMPSAMVAKRKIQQGREVSRSAGGSNSPLNNRE